MQTSKRSHVLMLFMLAMFFTACASEVTTESNRHAMRGSSDKAIVAQSMKTKGYDVPGKTDKDDDNGDEENEQENEGDLEPGKGGDEETDTDPQAGKGDDGDDVGIPVDNDDDYGKGGGEGGNPNQTPGQTPDDEDVVEEEPEDDVVVDLPEEACVYNDPEHPEFTIPADQFGPGLPPIAIPSSKLGGMIQADGETYIGSFSIFNKGGRPARWALEWDGRAGRVPHHYTLVVTKTVNAQCTAYLSHVAHDPRTRNGCFDQNTKIRMADGQDKVLALINVGDRVWNPILKESFAVKRVVKGPESDKPMYDIGFAGKVVRMTQNHPVPTAAGLKTAKDITLQDKILDASGSYHQVAVAKKLPLNKDQVVINLSLDTNRTDADAHMVLSEGIITGDLFLQERLEAMSQMSQGLAGTRAVAQ